MARYCGLARNHQLSEELTYQLTIKREWAVFEFMSRAGCNIARSFLYTYLFIYVGLPSFSESPEDQELKPTLHEGAACFCGAHV